MCVLLYRRIALHRIALRVSKVQELFTQAAFKPSSCFSHTTVYTFYKYFTNQSIFLVIVADVWVKLWFLQNLIHFISRHCEHEYKDWFWSNWTVFLWSYTVLLTISRYTVHLSRLVDALLLLLNEFWFINTAHYRHHRILCSIRCWYFCWTISNF